MQLSYQRSKILNYGFNIRKENQGAAKWAL